MVLVALASLAAGCVAPEDTASKANLLGYCPQWLQGPGQAGDSVDLSAALAEGTKIQAADAVWQGHPLDVYRVRLDTLDVAGGALELRAFRDDNHTSSINWYDYRSAGQPFRSVPFLSFRAGSNATGHEFDAVLAGLKQSDITSSGPVQFVWRFVADTGGGEGHGRAEYSVSYLYRVCGTP